MGVNLFTYRSFEGIFPKGSKRYLKASRAGWATLLILHKLRETNKDAGLGAFCSRITQNRWERDLRKYNLLDHCAIQYKLNVYDCVKTNAASPQHMLVTATPKNDNPARPIILERLACRVCQTSMTAHPTSLSWSNCVQVSHLCPRCYSSSLDVLGYCSFSDYLMS